MERVRRRMDRRSVLKWSLGTLVTGAGTAWAWNGLANPPDTPLQRKYTQVKSKIDSIENELQTEGVVIYSRSDLLGMQRDVRIPSDPRLEQQGLLKIERDKIWAEILTAEGSALYRVKIPLAWLGPIFTIALLSRVLKIASSRGHVPPSEPHKIVR